ncbi:LON peptidase substrate-binding domain-containing protein [Rubrivivax sp. A210]|uniref:LON peptidase substrate-binding domain-containing protein n=1 Tax=Rubrivivax sp. A210 TaxID=2772301 RepID=UPI001F2DB099|nr:LON peptidase substrate-binding domain-containing protein [Rubrivivax sp. A210]
MRGNPKRAKGAAPAAGWPDPLPLFPLRLVLFPGALLGLKVFEARYLDLVADCLRTRQPFGVVCLQAGAEVGGQAVALEATGTLAHIEEADAEQAGILRLRCHGGQRFRLRGQAQRRDNGLWVAPVEPLADDPPRLPGVAMLATVTALAEAIRKLRGLQRTPFAEPYRLDDAGWVANRWCELLPVPLAAKQKLMELEDPVLRLSLVDGFLRDKKVVVG